MVKFTRIADAVSIRVFLTLIGNRAAVVRFIGNAVEIVVRVASVAAVFETIAVDLVGVGVVWTVILGVDDPVTIIVGNEIESPKVEVGICVPKFLVDRA
ncbi:MAG: hypothetical protein AAF219_08025 [Myxococcota bacterium]